MTNVFMKSAFLLVVIILSTCSSDFSHHTKQKTEVTAQPPPASDTTAAQNQDTNFETFLAHFNSDSVFQKSRTLFPLKGTFLPDPTDEDSDSTFYVHESDFFFVQLTAPTCNLFDGLSVVQISGGTTRKTVTLSVEDTGIRIAYFFEKRAGKWMWIAYHDVST